MPPNILLIISDDCTYNDLPLFGGRNAKTPNIDRLAKAGLVFDRAYMGMAMCMPCRSELYTGLYPMRNGCAWNHAASRPEVTSMPHHLGDLGYRVGIAGKIGLKPEAAYPFELVNGFERNCCRNPTNPHDLTGIRTFMGRSSDPFCLVIGLVDPHVPWVMGDVSQYPPESLDLPPNLVDTAETREDFSRYLAEITYMDSQLGDILATLHETGHADDTLVLFTSEQGAQFPGAKWTTWNLGLHTGLVARWPGMVAPGKRTNALVQYADVLPTLVEAASGNPAAHDYDGISFLEILTGTAEESQRSLAYGMHNNWPEGPPYPSRTVSDGVYRYIRNLTSNDLYISKWIMGRKSDNQDLIPEYWQSWMMESYSDASACAQVRRNMLRPGEELYHSAQDPYEQNNLTDDPAYTEIKTRLSAELDHWMAEQGDPGIALDTPEAHRAAREGKHLYGSRSPLLS